MVAKEVIFYEEDGAYSVMTAKEFIRHLEYEDKMSKVQIAKYCGIDLMTVHDVLRGVGHSDRPYVLPSIEERKILRKMIEYNGGPKGGYKEGSGEVFDRPKKHRETMKKL